MDKFYLEVPTLDRKKDAIDYINEHLKVNSKINGSHSIHKYIDNYEGWLKLVNEERTITPNEERVPNLTFFLVRENDNKVVGMINIRLTLNSNLKKSGGHIGYGIRPSERRKGYNKINLYLGLRVLQQYGVKEAMLSCKKDNIGSSKTMIALGGKLVKEYTYEKDESILLQNYTIDVDDSLNKYSIIYEPYISTKGKRK